MSGRNVLIRASAGSGKTFQLAHRVIGMVLRGTPVDHVLATTFTRKAAGEILERVLARLAAAGLDPKACADVARHAGVPDATQDDVLRALASTVDGLHRLQIGTLDAFFARVAANFPLELGLPPRWTIVEGAEIEPLQLEAVAAVVDAGDDDLLQLLRMLDRGRSRRAVTTQITRVVGDLRDLYLETTEETWDWLRPPTPLSPDELDATLTTLANAPVDDKRQAKARDEDVARAQDGDWPRFLTAGLAKKLHEGVTLFYKKPIDPDLAAIYEPLLRHAAAKLVGQLADENRATYQLLRRFDEAYQDLKLRRRALEFSDITRVLDVNEALGSLDEVFFRLDGRIDHVLLDEFQDTSRVQWSVLRRLAEEVAGDASGNRSLFAVGDTKQAIYGWRGGEVAIFEHLEQEVPQLDLQTLDRSYRSSGPVIDAVNCVFDSLDGNAVARRDARTIRGSERWAEGFALHRTEFADRPGHVKVEVASAPEGEEIWIGSLQRAAELVGDVLPTLRGRDVGVLVRTNAAVARMRFELKQRGIEASEEGGIPLVDSPAVNLLLSALRVADHPGDTVAWAHLATGPLADTFTPDDTRTRAVISREVRTSLLRDGYGPTLMRWTRSLAPRCREANLRRLSQLVQLGHRFDRRPTLRPADFVRVVERTRVEDPRQEQVRVMTLHQAKGLEFDLVVLPELRENLVQRQLAMVHRDHPLATPTRVSRTSRADVRAFVPELVAMEEDLGAQDVYESLSLLYVGMTRARYALHVVLDDPGHRRTLPANMGGLLGDGFGAVFPWAPGSVLFEDGDPAWMDAVPPRESSRPDAGDADLRLPRPARSAPAPAPSHADGDPLSWDAAERRDRGRWVHAALESFTWWEDGLPDDAPDLPDPLDPADRDAWWAATRDALADPALRPWVSAEALRADWGVQELELWRERDFVTRVDGRIERGRYDRVVLGRREGQVVRALILDWKTDRLDGVDAQTAATVHARQLDHYAAALARRTGLSRDAITTAVVFLDGPVAVPLAGEARG